MEGEGKVAAPARYTGQAPQAGGDEFGPIPMRDSGQSPYAVLGLPEGADSKAIKKAYKKLARKYHPDKNRHDPNAEEKFKAIQEAYEVLMKKRKQKSPDNYEKCGDYVAKKFGDNFVDSTWSKVCLYICYFSTCCFCCLCCCFCCGKINIPNDDEGVKDVAVQPGANA